MSQVEGRNVEPFKCIRQSVWRQIAKESVEYAERKADFTCVTNILDGVKRLRAFNKADSTPEGPIRVKPEAPSVMSQKHARNFPAAASTELDTLQALTDMFGAGAHILNDKFRLTKHLRVDALQDKMFFPCGIQCDQEGVIDIAMPKFPDINNLTLWIELFCNCKKIVQVFPLSIQI